MSSNLKAVLAVVLLIALLVALVFLVHTKADALYVGMIAAALGTAIPMVFGWLIGGKQPPVGPAAVLLTAGSILLGTVDCGGVQDRELDAEQAYRKQQRACVAQYAERALILACRKAVREDWLGEPDADAKDGGR